MKVVAFATTTILLIGSIQVWADAHDREISQAANSYEQCVKAEYGMTPIAWYESHHKYPYCGN